MLYTSTRNNKIRVTAAQAIAQGISEEGGLFVPVELPHFSMDTVRKMMEMSYIDRAKTVLRTFLTDFSDEELNYCVEGAYRADKFSSPAVAPTVNIGGKENILELWHGPTCAFKDMALQLLPYLMTVSAKKTAEGKTIVILVATSGDTGKAALEGFKDVDKTKILVFYPEIKAELAKKNMMFSSANSINWGRLVPQIVYYFSAYADLCKMGQLQVGEPMNVVVPTGNFGNILAGYYAKHMGLPIQTMVCASNTNNVLTDFLKTGTYDRNRDFYATTSPSMDILISSNLERLLYHMSGESDAAVRGWMTQLVENGKYTVEPEVMAKIQNEFAAGYCDEAAVADTIHKTYTDQNYLCDTHTAVAVKVYRDYVAQTGDDLPTVIDSTASPYKFSKSVLTAVLEGKTPQLDEFDMVEELHRVTGAAVPAPLAALKDKAVRFTQVCDRENMSQMVFQLLNL